MYPEEIRRQVLREQGIDDSLYDIDDNGNIVLREQLQQSPTAIDSPQTVQRPVAKTSASTAETQTPVQTFLSQAAADILPSAASTVTMALGAPAVLGGGGIPAAVLLLGLAGGAGDVTTGLLRGSEASIIGNLFEKAGVKPSEGFYSENIRNYLEAGEQQNPIAALSGRLFGSIPFFGPATTSARLLPSALSKLGKAATERFSGLSKTAAGAIQQQALTAAEKAALLNIPANAAIAGGQEAAFEALLSDEIDPKKIAIASLVGGALSEPWGVGRKIFNLAGVPTSEYSPSRGRELTLSRGGKILSKGTEGMPAFAGMERVNEPPGPRELLEQAKLQKKAEAEAKRKKAEEEKAAQEAAKEADREAKLLLEEEELERKLEEDRRKKEEAEYADALKTFEAEMRAAATEQKRAEIAKRREELRKRREQELLRREQERLEREAERELLKRDREEARLRREELRRQEEERLEQERLEREAERLLKEQDKQQELDKALKAIKAAETQETPKPPETPPSGIKAQESFVGEKPPVLPSDTTTTTTTTVEKPQGQQTPSASPPPLPKVEAPPTIREAELSALRDALDKMGLKTTDPRWQGIVKELFRRYGIKSVIDYKLYETSKRVGQYDTTTKKVTLDPNKTSFETPAHEITHAFFDELTPEQKAELSTQIENSPKYKIWKNDRAEKKLTASPEEFLADRAGISWLKRAITNEEGFFKRWLGDIRAHKRLRGQVKKGTVDVDDLGRLIARRLTAAEDVPLKGPAKAYIKARTTVEERDAKIEEALRELEERKKAEAEARAKAKAATSTEDKNAIQKQSSDEVGVRKQEAVGKGVGGKNAEEQKTAGESKGNEKQEDVTKGQEEPVINLYKGKNAADDLEKRKRASLITRNTTLAALDTVKKDTKKLEQLAKGKSDIYPAVNLYTSLAEDLFSGLYRAALALENFDNFDAHKSDFISVARLLYRVKDDISELNDVHKEGFSKALKDYSSNFKAFSDTIQEAVDIIHPTTSAQNAFRDVLRSLAKHDIEEALLKLNEYTDDIDQRADFSFIFEKPVEKGQLKKPRSTQYEGTKNFKEAFKDTVVKDSTGRPKVVYHLSRGSNFNVFNIGPEGAHFGSALQAFGRFLDTNELLLQSAIDVTKAPHFRPQGTYAVYLDIKKPLYTDDAGSNWQPIIERAKAAGYDGIIYKNAYEGPGYSYIVFDPKQIKSATGNTGAFDLTKPSILAQEEPVLSLYRNSDAEDIKQRQDVSIENEPIVRSLQKYLTNTYEKLAEKHDVSNVYDEVRAKIRRTLLGYINTLQGITNGVYHSIRVIQYPDAYKAVINGYKDTASTIYNLEGDLKASLRENTQQELINNRSELDETIKILNDTLNKLTPVSVLQSEFVRIFKDVADFNFTAALEKVSKLKDNIEQSADFSLLFKRPGEIEISRPPRRTHYEGTSNFEKAFKDTVVKDSTGRPKVVYHLSKYPGFDVFNIGPNGAHFGSALQAFGRFLDTHSRVLTKGLSSYESTDTSPGTYAVYLNIKKPLYTDDAGLRWEPVIKRAKAAGYDGIIYKNAYEGPGESYIVFDRRQIKSATGNKGTFYVTKPSILAQEEPVFQPNTLPYKPVTEPSKPPLGDDSTRQFIPEAKKSPYDYHAPGLRFMASAADKVSAVHGEKFGRALADADAEASFLYGRITNRWLDILTDFPKDTWDKTHQWLAEVDYWNRRGITDREKMSFTIDVTPEMQELESRLRAVYEEIKDRANEAGIRGGLAEKDPNSWVNMVSQDVVKILQDQRPTAEYRRIRKIWEEHLAKFDTSPDLTYEQKLINAKRKIDDYVRAVSTNRYATPEFGALYKAAGRGVPLELQEKSLVKALTRYGNRAAKSIGFAKHIQNNPDKDIPVFFGYKTERGEPIEPNDPNVAPAGDRVVRDALAYLREDFHFDHQVIRGISKIVNASLLGPVTGVRDFIQTFGQVSPYISSASDAGKLLKGAVSMSKYVKDSLYAGARTKRMLDFDFGIVNDPDYIADNFDKVAYALRKYSGRDALENGARIMAYAMGKELVHANFRKAVAGNADGVAFIKKFSEGISNWKEIVETPAKATPEFFDRLAKNFVDRVQGTYSLRGLPLGAQAGSWAPWLALSRWSIEKANVIYKDVIVAAKHGNFKPLLAYTMASVPIGVVIRELNEFVNARKSEDPTFEEAWEAEEETEEKLINLVMPIIATLQLASYGGILSDTLKAISDISLRGETPRGISFPTADLLGALFSETLVDYAGALRQGMDPIKATVGMAEKTMRDMLQVYRVIANQTYRKKELERSSKLRDLRTYSRLTGDYVPPIGKVRGNLFMNPASREFKHASTVREAMESYPEALKEAFTGDTPEEIQRNLTSLKSMQYQTMPDYERDPVKFAKFMSWLSKTQSPEAASKRLGDWISQKELNRFKSKLVPTL